MSKLISSNMCEFHISTNQTHKPKIALDSFSLS